MRPRTATVRAEGKFRLVFVSNRGETFEVCEPIDEAIASDLERIKPPFPPDIPTIGQSFNEVVEIMRRKQFRRDLFVREAFRLGQLLADRMEDAEGWHDMSRMEPAQASLKGKPVDHHFVPYHTAEGVDAECWCGRTDAH